LLAHCGGGQDKPGSSAPQRRPRLLYFLGSIFPPRFLFPGFPFRISNFDFRFLRFLIFPPAIDPPAFHQRKTDIFVASSAYKFQEEARFIPPGNPAEGLPCRR